MSANTPPFTFKRLRSQGWVTTALAGLVGGYIRLVHKTGRWTIIGKEQIRAINAAEKGVMFAFWHDRLLMIPATRTQTSKKVSMLISAHRDGALIAQTMRSFNVDTIKGSASNPRKRFKNKAGMRAGLEITRQLQNPSIIGITPDGPRGPRRKVQPGIAILAYLSGAPIYPCAYASRRGYALSSWDKMWLPVPFSSGVIAFGAPIAPPTDKNEQTLTAYCTALEAALNNTVDLAMNSLQSSQRPKE